MGDTPPIAIAGLLFPLTRWGCGNSSGMSTTASHPTNDPNLPSFLHPNLAAVQDDLQTVLDIWNDLKGCKQSYLPKESQEPDIAYRNRLKRSQFDNRFNPALRGHAGLLSEFALTPDTPQSLIDNEKNIDQQGSDLASLMTTADEMVLRDGGCGVLVEFPPETVDGPPQSAIEWLESGRRPYLVLVDRRDILNWDISYVQGMPIINRVVIREVRMVKVGLFGCQSQIFYRVLSPGRFEVYQLLNSGGKWTAQIVEEGTTSLDRVPLVWYSVSSTGQLFEGALPFMNLARLNIEHLQKRSGLTEVMHKCNMPVPVRKGFVKSVQDALKQLPRLIIGPNSIVDIPENGSFSFAEPAGTAIAATQADIAKLETAMDRVSLSFLGSEGGKTATEVLLDSAQTQATLKAMARRKESCSQQIFALWGNYTGEPGAGSIDVNEAILQVPPTAQDVQVILDAMGIQISRALGLRMLLERRWLPADTDIDAELSLTEPPPEPEPPATPPEPGQPVAVGPDGIPIPQPAAPQRNDLPPPPPYTRSVAPPPPTPY